MGEFKMKKVLGIIIVFTLVLGICSSSLSGPEPDVDVSTKIKIGSPGRKARTGNAPIIRKEIGRYQVVSFQFDTTKYKTFLVDTATGQTWIFDIITEKGKAPNPKWIKIPFNPKAVEKRRPQK